LVRRRGFLIEILFVLGAPNDKDGNLSETSLRRINKAAEIWQKETECEKPLIVLTGGFGKHFNTTERPHWRYAREKLLNLGLPDDSVDKSGLESSNTVEDAALVLRYLKEKPYAQGVVVTTEAHLERCTLTFACLSPGTSIAFVGTDEPVNIEVVEHEKQAIMRLRAQGGVQHKGRLYPMPIELK